MASAKFLEEVLSTDVDESAVSAIVGSLETQLVTSTASVSASTQQTSNVVLNQNHINSAISNGASVPAQKHEGVANGESISVVHTDANKSVAINSVSLASSISNTDVSHTVSNSLQTQVATTFITQECPAASSSAPITNLAKSNEQNAAQSQPAQTVKLVYGSGGGGGGPQPMPSAGAILNRVSFPAQPLPNGNIGLAPLTASPAALQQAAAVVSSAASKQAAAAIVIKTSGGGGGGPGAGLVTVPMSAAASLQQQQQQTQQQPHVNSVSHATNIMTLAKPVAPTTQTTLVQQATPSGLLPGNVQIVNVRPGVSAAAAAGTTATPKAGGVQSRVVLAAPQMVGARPGQPSQITLQSLQGLQPGQQGHLLLKTENGQYQLLRVGPAPAPAAQPLPVSGAPAAAATYRLQTVPAVSRLNTQFAGPPLTLRKTIVQQPNSVAPTPASSPAPVQVQQVVSTVTAASNVTPAQTTANATPIQRQNSDNTKEKCRKFLANLLELSSREPKSVERNVRTLIQELIDCKVEPEEFCDRLERLLNASPQPCLIGFLKKSLPLLRQSLVTKELTIDGIRPPPVNVVFPTQATVATPVGALTAQVRPAVSHAQVRIVTPAAAVRPAAAPMPPRVVTPARVPAPGMGPRVLAATVRNAPPAAAGAAAAVIVSTSQPPALHPVFPTAGAVRAAVSVMRPTLQVRAAMPSPLKPPATAIRTGAPLQLKAATPGIKAQLATAKPTVPSSLPKPTAKEKEKKSFSSAYTGDDDINDVAAMGGVNLAEETQRILGSTEFVGTQIRSCKDEMLLLVGSLQARTRAAAERAGLAEPGADVTALISHAAQEYLKNLVEKLAVITDHRVELLKNDPRYEVSQDVKGQLKFLEELDRAERKRHEEQERQLLLRAAKSRSKSEDPEQAKLKAKAKEMQRVELEELRQREANATALQAIGPRKKQRLDGDALAGGSVAGVTATGSGAPRAQLPLRQRTKKASMRDLLFLMEQERETCRGALLYRSYLK